MSDVETAVGESRPVWSVWHDLLPGLGIGLAGGLTWVGWFGGQDWRLDLLSHFRVQLVVLHFVLLLGLLLGLRGPRRWVWLGLLMPGLLGNGWPVLPYYVPHAARSATPTGARLKLLHINVFAPNQRFDLMAKVIRQYDADVVELMEYTEDSRRGLEATGVFGDYPHRVTGRAHLGLYSKLPLRDTELRFVGQEQTANFANLLTRVKVGDQLVTLLVAHPHWPYMDNLARQRLHFETWIRERQSYGEHLIVMGDLNTSPWSYGFRQLVAQTDLRDSQLGFGVQPSWPRFVSQLGRFEPSWLFGVLGIPIDHVVVSSGFEVLRRETGPFVGSDHQPLFVEIYLR